MEWINNITLGLIELYATRNVYELCDYLGIEIRPIESSNIILHQHESFYYRNLNNKEIIFVNKELDDNIKEFVLKHELGHALLHTKILDSRMCNKGKLERQANYFALKLSNIQFDEIELEGMTLEQIASSLDLPLEPLKQVINL